MKHLLLFIFFIILIIILTFFVVHKFYKVESKRKKILLSIGISLVLITIYFFGYMQIYYHADEKAQLALKGNDEVNVVKIGNDYLFDGPGTKEAIIFIPGARVEETAYAPLLLKLSQEGVDAFLMKMPLRMATFEINAPDRIIEKYKYDNWYIAGHSLGGVVASFNAESNPEIFKGLILLAAYPTKKIPDNISMLSIYGEYDGCLSMNEYKKNKVNWPINSSEIILEGANHSNYGNYGLQDEDKEVELTQDTQQSITIEKILEFISKVNHE